MNISVDYDALKKFIIKQMTQEQWNSFFEWHHNIWPDSTITKEQQMMWFKGNCELLTDSSYDNDKFILKIEVILEVSQSKDITTTIKASFALRIPVN